MGPNTATFIAPADRSGVKASVTKVIAGGPAVRRRRQTLLRLDGSDVRVDAFASLMRLRGGAKALLTEYVPADDGGESAAA